MSKGVLYTCDFICYGVASPSVFQDYLALLTDHKGKAIKRYIHRGGGLKTGEGEKAIYSDGSEESNNAYTNIWSRLWYHYVLRESCYCCKYHSFDRPGNITIGDYWGIESVVPGFKDEWGVSCFLINDRRGETLFEQVKPFFELQETRLEDVANEAQPMLYRQPNDDCREKFWGPYWTDGFKSACKQLGVLGWKTSTKSTIGQMLLRLLRMALKIQSRILGTKQFLDVGGEKSFAEQCCEEKPHAKYQGNKMENSFRHTRGKQISYQQEQDFQWQTMTSENAYPRVYAGKHVSKEVRMQSSSGGAFYALANHVIEQGGVVYGCAFNNRNEAVHVRCTTKEQIKQCMGSKYSQSNLGDSIQKVRDDLSKGIAVLFTGTPCQVAAVRSVCEVGYNNSVIAAALVNSSEDQFCEGVDSSSNKQGIPVLFCNEEECCGCSACAAVCPVGAITMRNNKKGFFYPVINEALCTKCMKCKQVCSFKQ